MLASAIVLKLRILTAKIPPLAWPSRWGRGGLESAGLGRAGFAALVEDEQAAVQADPSQARIRVAAGPAGGHRVVLDQPDDFACGAEPVDRAGAARPARYEAINDAMPGTRGRIMCG